MLAKFRVAQIKSRILVSPGVCPVRSASDGVVDTEAAKRKTSKHFARPKVTKKTGRVWKTSDGHLQVKELSQLLRVIDKHERASVAKVKTCSNLVEPTKREADGEEVAEIQEGIQSQVAVAKVAERYRKQLKENGWRKNKVERRLSFHYLRFTLQPYLHACINSNAFDKAHYTLMWYRNKFARLNNHEDSPIVASVYNIVMKGWCRAGKIHKIQELFRLMNQAKVAPNMQSYALYLLCLVKQPNYEIVQLEQILSSMRQRDLKPENLFLESFLSQESRDLIESAVQKLESPISFTKSSFNTSYDCKLMEGFENLPRTSYQPVELTSKALTKWMGEQHRNEVTGFVRIKSVYKDKSTDIDKAGMYKQRWDKWETQWKDSFTSAFDRNIRILKNKFQAYYGMNILPFLTVMKTEIYVNAMLNEMHYLGRISDSYSPPVKYLYESLGKRIMNRYITERHIKEASETTSVYERFLEDYCPNERNIGKYTPRSFVLTTASENGFYLQDDINEMRWSSPIFVAVGKFLYDIILKETVIDANVLRANSKKARLVPVFYNVFVSGQLRTQEEIRTHPTFTKLYKLANMNDLFFDTTMLPMVVPPFPWISYKVGGYLMAKTDFIRDSGHDEGMMGIKLAAKANLGAVYDALNVLSFCPWKINQRVLDVMMSVFQNNGDMSLEIPLHQSAMPPVPKLDSNIPYADRIAMLKNRYKIKQKRAEMYSLWCDCLYKLSIANHFRHRIFWFPQNLDFRGRVYSTPPHFNHLGGDVARGLLLFAKGKPLGPKGLNWLKLHVVNLTGLKKRAPLSERLDYADEMMDKILDSADYPLTGNRWWTESEEPWQTLAACVEIAKAIRSGNPEEYICHFPVHQDGSCNGLQHYAALGRDEEGAISVNLEPDEKPNDVYSTVASYVETERRKDAESNVEIAKYLDGIVSRKVVKQTVMTYVYGVTRFGARLQILKRLKDNDSFPQEHTWAASFYLTSKTFLSIQQMFTATRKIQDWFTTCARDISLGLGEPMQWVTPLSFPVIQPYFKTSGGKTASSEIMRYKDEACWKTNVMKQKNAFPPNFIHSLDSTHMMLTGMHCERLGMTFVAVHDSYWTHPSSVDVLNTVCREQFVALHSQPILHDLSDFMVKTYEPALRAKFKPADPEYQQYVSLFRAVPRTGKFNLSNVLKSTYFFS